MFNFFKRKKKMPKEVTNLFEEIIERARRNGLDEASNPETYQPEKASPVVTKNAIYKEFSKYVKANFGNLSKESLSQISDFKINKIISGKNGINKIKYEFRWNGKLHQESLSSSIYEADRWAAYLYSSIYTDYDPQNNDSRVRILVKKVRKEAKVNLARRKVPKSLGYCHRVWDEQKRILKKKYNIDWKTPAERHPDTKFD